MKRFLFPGLAALALSLSSMAHAEEPDEDASEEVDRITGKKPPPLDRTPRSPDLKWENKELTVQETAARPFPHEAYLGAEMLQMDPQFVYGVQSGLELMYERKYEEAREHFVELDKVFPGTGMASTIDTVVWQALMLENFDFKYDKQYWTSSKEAKSTVEAALKKPGSEAWENLLMATLLGIESIHTMRKAQYLSALQTAFSAMDHITKSREAAPDFIDLKMADGLYNYWRSVVTMNSKVLPDFGDKRVEGLEEMMAVEKAGVVVAPMATLSLVFAWIEEGELRNALSACMRNKRAYPDNIVNLLVTSQVQIYQRNYSHALDTLNHVFKVDPKNKRARYWRGLAYLRTGKLAEAKADFETYIAFDSLEKYQQAYTNYRLGQVYNREKNYAKAYEHYKAAVKLDGHASSKKAMERMDKRKKEGKIDF